MDARLPSGVVGGPRAPASFYCPISMVRRLLHGLLIPLQLIHVMLLST